MKFKFITKENISHLPKSPGVYVFRKDTRFLYIGKAANIKERVKNHLQQARSVWEQTLLRQGFGGRVGFIKTDSEIEALILEAKLIKKYQPKYNVMWRDDKNYFYVGITKEDFPTVFITHQPLRQGLRASLSRTPQNKPKLKIDYIGPFVEGRELKQALNVLRRIFPYRTCKPYTGRPCLWYQLGRCPGPCLLGSKLAKEIPKLEKTIKKESRRNTKNLEKILQGGKNQALKNLKKEMKNASKIRDFEKAAKIRDQIGALEKVMEHARIFEPEVKTGNWQKTSEILKKILKTRKSISRIEAYDISNIQGENATGSMVTFINGKPDKNFYRKFKIRNRASKGSESKNIRSSLPFAATRVGEEENEVLFALTEKPNDVAMIKEVLTRRFQHPEWSRPDLILIDGGKPQLNIALRCLNSPRYHPPSAELRGKKFKQAKVMALAKKRSVAKPRTKLRFGAGENKLFIEGKKEPILLKTLPREVFNLILQLRDEAHRFALAYHRKLREKF